MQRPPSSACSCQYIQHWYCGVVVSADYDDDYDDDNDGGDDDM